MPDIRELAIKHAQCTHAALEVARQEMEKIAAERARVQTLIPQAVAALVKHARIEQRDADLATRLFSDPAKVLEVLIKTANPAETTHPTPMGKPQVKSGGVNGNGRAERESDRKFRQDILGTDN